MQAEGRDRGRLQCKLNSCPQPGQQLLLKLTHRGHRSMLPPDIWDCTFPKETGTVYWERCSLLITHLVWHKVYHCERQVTSVPEHFIVLHQHPGGVKVSERLSTTIAMNSCSPKMNSARAKEPPALWGVLLFPQGPRRLLNKEGGWQDLCLEGWGSQGNGGGDPPIPVTGDRWLQCRVQQIPECVWGYRDVPDCSTLLHEPDPWVGILRTPGLNRVEHGISAEGWDSTTKGTDHGRGSAQTTGVWKTEAPWAPEEDEAEQSDLWENKDKKQDKKVETGQKSKGSLERQVRGDPGFWHAWRQKPGYLCVRSSRVKVQNLLDLKLCPQSQCGLSFPASPVTAGGNCHMRLQLGDTGGILNPI